MIWVRSPVFVLEEFVWAEGILVRTGSSCRDRKRDLGENSWLPDTRCAYKRYLLALEGEARLQCLARKHLAMKLGLLGKPIEGSEADLMVRAHVG
jgi:hypothetical protein